jgi:glycosyltransferase involved in cell wall biosynthesis
MKVLFLATNSPILEAGTRYRVAQYLNHVSAAGHHTTLHTFFPAQGGRSWKLTARGLLQRSSDIAQAHRYDLALVYRELLPHGINHAIPLVSAQVPYVFDFDDSVFLPTQKGWRALVSSPSSTAKLVAGAKVVFAGNTYLGDYARQFSDRVEVLPTVVDTSRYCPITKPERKVPLIGWIGSYTTAPYLDRLLPMLDALAKDVAFKLRIVGTPRPIRLQNVEVECPRWSAETEHSFFQDLDVGLYPLTDDAWSRGKCGFKAIQYMACEVPSVVSPVGVVQEIVRDGRDGLWASSLDQWREALIRLLRDPDLRVTLGRSGRTRIESDYSLRAMAPRFLAGLERARR